MGVCKLYKKIFGYKKSCPCNPVFQVPQQIFSKFAGSLLLALFVFLAISLMSYAPSDPPDLLVFPAPDSAQNIAGIAGAYSASFLLNAFGYGVIVLAFPLFFGAVFLILGVPITQINTRIAGFTLILIGVCGFAAVFRWDSPGPIIGPGGSIGAILFHFLNPVFSQWGNATLFVSFMLAGLILASDYTLIRLIYWAIGIAPLNEAIEHLFPEKQQPKVDAYFGEIVQEQPLGAQASSLQIGECNIFRADEDITLQARCLRSQGISECDPDDAIFYSENEEPEEEIQLKEETPIFIEEFFEPSDEESSDDALTIAEVLQEMETGYELPSVQLLAAGESVDRDEKLSSVQQLAKELEIILKEYKVNAKVTDIQTGPVIAQFELELERGLRVYKLQKLEDDLAIRLKVPSVRVVTPIPGKNTVGVEIPNEIREIVRLRDVMDEAKKEADAMFIPIFLGKDVAGKPIVVDLAKMPHLLIAGRTGTGKSVCLNSIIVSMLMTRNPEQIRLILIDPKMVELISYKSIPHLMHPVITDMKKAEAVLAWAVDKMEERYQLLARAGVRQLSEYNRLPIDVLEKRVQPETEDEWNNIPKKLPFLVIVADEMADLMMTSAKEVETHIIRLAQKSRAVGIHLVLATQKPTVDIITGLIKSNLPARIAFEVASKVDSLVVLDRIGAERLLGNGDMLFLKPGTSLLIRGQGTYVTDDEIEDVVYQIGTEEQHFAEELMTLENSDAPTEKKDEIKKDEKYDECVEHVIREGKASTSMLQRNFRIGFARSGRITDMMTREGIIGPPNGSQFRDVLVTMHEWRKRQQELPSVIFMPEEEDTFDN